MGPLQAAFASFLVSHLPTLAQVLAGFRNHPPFSFLYINLARVPFDPAA
jgi:hypothetical protein